ncbi:MAG: hypothetical protein ACYDCL_21260 [Myxococcales bacterium]
MAHLTTKPSAVKPGEFELELQKMDQGFTENLPPTLTLPINGTPMTVAAMEGQFKGYLATFRAVDAAEQALAAAVNARNAVTVEARTFYKAAKQAVKLHLGPQSPLLSSFGIPMDKARQTDTKTLAIAQGRARQTREVRGTKSEKQRLAITVVGNPSVTITSNRELLVGPRPVNLTVASASAAAPADGSAQSHLTVTPR